MQESDDPRTVELDAVEAGLTVDKEPVLVHVCTTIDSEEIQILNYDFPSLGTDDTAISVAEPHSATAEVFGEEVDSNRDVADSFFTRTKEVVVT